MSPESGRSTRRSRCCRCGILWLAIRERALPDRQTRNLPSRRFFRRPPRPAPGPTSRERSILSPGARRCLGLAPKAQASPRKLPRFAQEWRPQRGAEIPRSTIVVARASRAASGLPCVCLAWWLVSPIFRTSILPYSREKFFTGFPSRFTSSPIDVRRRHAHNRPISSAQG